MVLSNSFFSGGYVASYDETGVQKGGSVSQPYGYQGMWKDQWTGFLRGSDGRLLDTNAGRWINQSQIGDGGASGSTPRYLEQEIVPPTPPVSNSSWVGDHLGWVGRRLDALGDFTESVGDDTVMIAKFVFSNPSEAYQAASEGYADGKVIVANRLTFGLIKPLNTQAQNLIETNGGLYKTADTAAGIGRTALLAATGVGLVGQIGTALNVGTGGLALIGGGVGAVSYTTQTALTGGQFTVGGFAGSVASGALGALGGGRVAVAGWRAIAGASLVGGGSSAVGSVTQQLIDNGSVSGQATLAAFGSGLIGGGVGAGVFRGLGAPLGAINPSALSCNLGFRSLVNIGGRQVVVSGLAGATADAAVQVAEIAVGAKHWSDFSFSQSLAAGLSGIAGASFSFAATRALFASCFAGETKLLARGPWGEGYRRIDEITLEDQVASRDENNVAGPVAWKSIEELFMRTGRILHLHVGGQVIRTTGEHPFFEYTKGWVDASALLPGDRLATLDGQWVTVQEAYDTGEYETVYNLRVQDYHTYFVGSEEWGFSVWAHNAYTNNNADDVAVVTRRSGARLEQQDGKWVTVTINSQGQEVVRSATGRYAFVSRNGEIRVLRRGSDPISDHTALAGMGPVDYAGEIAFPGRTSRGQLRWWNNDSGHFTPGSADAHTAGLPMDLFRPLPGT